MKSRHFYKYCKSCEKYRTQCVTCKSCICSANSSCVDCKEAAGHQKIYDKDNESCEFKNMMDGGVCISFEDTKAELEVIESKLAKRLGLIGDSEDIHFQIIKLIENGLEEDSLVADWHAEYSSFLDWFQGESYD